MEYTDDLFYLYLTTFCELLPTYRLHGAKNVEIMYAAKSCVLWLVWQWKLKVM